MVAMIPTNLSTIAHMLTTYIQEFDLAFRFVLKFEGDTLNYAPTYSLRLFVSVPRNELWIVILDLTQ
jgi:hypothetical protein